MNIETYIPDLFEDFSTIWNSGDMKKFGDLLAEDVSVNTPGLNFTNIAIDSVVAKGKKEAILFFKKSRKKLPLCLKISDFVDINGKHVSFKAHYFEIDVWSLFDCDLSKYGKIKQITITRLESTESTTISKIYILKNIVKHKLKMLR